MFHVSDIISSTILGGYYYLNFFFLLRKLRFRHLPHTCYTSNKWKSWDSNQATLLPCCALSLDTIYSTRSFCRLQFGPLWLPLWASMFPNVYLIFMSQQSLKWDLRIPLKFFELDLTLFTQLTLPGCAIHCGSIPSDSSGPRPPRTPASYSISRTTLALSRTCDLRSQG